MSWTVPPEDAKEFQCQRDHKPLYKKTYPILNAIISLNPKNIFDVVSDIDDYVSYQKSLAERESLRPGNSAVLEYKGATLELKVGVYRRNQRIIIKPLQGGVVLKKVSLAKLVLSDSNLTLKIKSNQDIVINPKELVRIGRKYRL